MKIKFLITVFLGLNCSLFSQLPCPLQSGINDYAMPYDKKIFCFPDYTNNNIRSQNNQVISLSEGKISRILIHKDNSKSVFVRSDNNEFFVYSNLEKVLFNINDKVEKNQILGSVLPDEEDKENYMLNFQLWKKTERIRVDLKCNKPN